MEIPPHVPEDRRAEYLALVALLVKYSRPGDEQALSAALRVARCSVDDGHLWRTMQLGSREELRALMERHFPALAAGITKDMRWKKYLYKRLCGWQGFDG
jgi:nitrogen fixation protein NifQ